MDFGVASGVMEKAEKGSGGGSGSSMLKGISFGAYSSFVWFFEEGVILTKDSLASRNRKCYGAGVGR